MQAFSPTYYNKVSYYNKSTKSEIEKLVVSMSFKMSVLMPVTFQEVCLKLEQSRE